MFGPCGSRLLRIGSKSTASALQVFRAALVNLGPQSVSTHVACCVVAKRGAKRRAAGVNADSPFEGRQVRQTPIGATQRHA